MTSLLASELRRMTSRRLVRFVSGLFFLGISLIVAFTL